MPDSTAPEGRSLSDDMDAIRDRTEADFVTAPDTVTGPLAAELMQARTDRAALLAELDRLRAEHTDMRRKVAFAAAIVSGDAAEMLPETIKQLRAENTALAAKLESVGKVHFEKSSLVFEMSWCFACGDNWPCPTARALGGDQDGGDR